MRITHFPTPWDEQSSSQRVRFYTVLSSGTEKYTYIFYQGMSFRKKNQ